jgi:two-component system phosphate regulon sensor histidine kinase PhoR
VTFAVTFRTKLLASHVGLVLAVVSILIFQLDRSLLSDLERQLDQRLEQQASGAAQWGVGEGRRHPEKVAARLATVLDAEVTIFDAHGKVVGDSRFEKAPPDESPPNAEVTAALAGGIGKAARRVPGVSSEMHYVAVPTADGWVVRLGVPLSDVDATLHAMRSRLLFASALALLAALGLGLLASRVAAGPLRAMTASAKRIAEGDFEIDVASTAPDDFGVLSRSLGSLATQLKARIGELTAERDRLTAILAGMAEGVLVLDRSGTIVLANPAAAKVLDIAGGLEGKSLGSLGGDEQVRSFIASALEGSETREAEIASGERWIAVYVRPLESRAGGGVVSVLRDMTPVRRAMTMRRDFMANASHELRTPVTAIQGYAETLLRGTADAATSRQFLEIIHRHGRRLGSLVDDVLKLTALEDRPREDVIREEISVADAAISAADTIRARADAANVRVEVDVPHGLVTTGDPTALEQVLENLVDNAVKYGAKPSGGVVRVVGHEENGVAIVTVSDEGAGIEAPHLPRLFERFYRVDPSRSRERGGTGLGLAIVKQLVESMGGEVTVASSTTPPSTGTTFTIRFAPRGVSSARP